MVDIQNVLRFLDAQATTPKYFGIFHLVFIALTLIAAITLCILWKKEKIRSVNRLILIVSVVLLALGVYKQVVLSFQYEPSVSFVYDWDNFFWNFLSMPLLVGLFIGFTPESTNKHFLSYYATFGLLAGAFGMFRANVFVPTIGLNVYHMLCYGSFIALAVLIFYSQSARIEIGTFLKALPVFVMTVGVAITFNEIGELLLPQHKISLFEISRHDESITPVYSSLHNLFYSTGGGMSFLEYVCCILFYILLVSAVAILPLLVMMIIKKLVTTDFEAEFERRDTLAAGIRSSEGLDVEDSQDIFNFSGKVNSSNNTFMKTYFKNLRTNFGENTKGSCGYVAISMLLSYYDTILSDKIVPRQFDKPTVSHDEPDFTNSPGVKFYQFPFDPAEISYKDYVKVINKAKNNYLHECLLSIAISKNLNNAPVDKESTDFNFATNVEGIESVLNHYLKSVAGVRSSEYDVHIKDNSRDIATALVRSDVIKAREYSNEIRKYVISKVKKGYPVYLEIGVSGAVNTGHAAIAYDYDKNTDQLYCHMGWQTKDLGDQKLEYTHLTPEQMGYTIYKRALVLEFDESKISHTHTNNYEVVVNGALFYYCPDRRYTTCDDLLIEFGQNRTELSITGVYKKYPKDQLTIPEYIGDVKVVHIAPSAFENQEHIKRAVISANVPAIPKKAFEDCESLVSVVIPASVKKIGSEAFGECKKLVNIVYLGTKEQWHSINKSSSWDKKTGNYTVHCIDGSLIKLHAEGKGDLLDSEQELTKLNEKGSAKQFVAPTYIINEKLEKIGRYAFDKNGNITRAIILDGVSEIPKKAFDECKDLVTVEIPASVKKINSEAFGECRELLSIIYFGTRKKWFEIDKSSSWDKKSGEYRVSCLDGVLSKFEAQGNGDFLDSKEDSIKKRVSTTISGEQPITVDAPVNIRFAGINTTESLSDTEITHIVVPDKTFEISKKDFKGFEALTTVIIPTSVRKIEKDAFDGCLALADIIYLGTVAQWNGVRKSKSWDDNTGNYRIHCVNGVINKPEDKK